MMSFVKIIVLANQKGGSGSLPRPYPWRRVLQDLKWNGRILCFLNSLSFFNFSDLLLLT
ncbi:hypothetical protein FRUB_09841 [Fimbriiglobus ruber]|uniref:Uncharacterized protein n=1 Tax=Fimbriiglobus ruber TaxID=1908690 RepID=A0A225DCX1_9BACT|nr:hypothetical protein FRUB_09841 [Fimbriiglobus ruber]